MNLSKVDFAILSQNERTKCLFDTLFAVVVDMAPELNVQYTIYLDLCNIYQNTVHQLQQGDKPLCDKLPCDKAPCEKAPCEKPQHERPQYDRSQYYNDQLRMVQPEKRQFDRPPFEKPHYNNPQLDRSQFDRSQFNRPQYNKQFDRTPKPAYDKVLAERIQHERPQYERPQYERSQYEKQHERPQYEKPQYKGTPYDFSYNSAQPKQKGIQKERKEDKYKRLAEERANKRAMKADAPRAIIKVCECGGNIYNKKFDKCSSCFKSTLEKPTDAELAVKCPVHFESTVNNECFSCKQG